MSVNDNRSLKSYRRIFPIKLSYSVANKGVRYFYNDTVLFYDTTCLRDKPKLVHKLHLLNDLIWLTYYLLKV